MSQITENTLVIKNELVEKLKEIIEKDEYSSQLKFEDFIEVYKDDKISIFTFDCNGSPLCIDKNIEYEILETNYLEDEDSYWTQTRDGDTDKKAKELLKKIISKDNYASLAKLLQYSNELKEEL